MVRRVGQREPDIYSLTRSGYMRIANGLDSVDINADLVDSNAGVRYLQGSISDAVREVGARIMDDARLGSNENEGRQTMGLTPMLDAVQEEGYDISPDGGVVEELDDTQDSIDILMGREWPKKIVGQCR